MPGRELETNNSVGTGKFYFPPGRAPKKDIIPTGPGDLAKTVQHGHCFGAETGRAFIAATEDVTDLQPQAAGALLNNANGEFPILGNGLFHLGRDLQAAGLSMRSSLKMTGRVPSLQQAIMTFSSLVQPRMMEPPWSAA